MGSQSEKLGRQRAEVGLVASFFCEEHGEAFGDGVMASVKQMQWYVGSSHRPSVISI